MYFFSFFQCHVEIYITDINDNNPTFTEQSYTISIPEDIPLNRSVITVNATDKDTGNMSFLFLFGLSWSVLKYFFQL